MDGETLGPTTVEPFDMIPCPECGEPTDSLKQYHYVNRCFFFGVGAYVQGLVVRACPGCMRQIIGRKCLTNAIPGNLLWLVLFLPLGLVLIATSYLPGHSRAVLKGISPAMVVAGPVRNDELRRRVIACFGLLLFWTPLVGLGVAAYAFSLNRQSADWAALISKVALAGALLVHVALLFVYLADQR